VSLPRPLRCPELELHEGVANGCGLGPEWAVLIRLRDPSPLTPQPIPAAIPQWFLGYPLLIPDLCGISTCEIDPHTFSFNDVNNGIGQSQFVLLALLPCDNSDSRTTVVNPHMPNLWFVAHKLTETLAKWKQSLTESRRGLTLHRVTKRQRRER
jgi:hypothetical protein